MTVSYVWIKQVVLGATKCALSSKQQLTSNICLHNRVRLEVRIIGIIRKLPHNYIASIPP